MSETVFFRLLDGVNRPSRLSDSIEELREGGETADVYSAELPSLRQVPGSSFAYWVSEEVRSKFAKLPPFESQRRKVKQGLATADDFRFVRAWWETNPRRTAHSRDETLQGKRWVPFAKGGKYAPYYVDVHLVVNWEHEGQEIKGNLNSQGKVRSNVWMLRETISSYFFTPGLTWPKLPHKRGSFQALPEGCIFSHAGMGVFAPSDQLLPLVALLNSDAYLGLIGLLMPRGTFGGQTLKFEVGYVISVPIPLSASTDGDSQRLAELARICTDISRELDLVNEPSHAFRVPALLSVQGESLDERITAWEHKVAEAQARLARNQAEINDIAYGLYDIEEEDRRVLEASLNTVTGDSPDGGKLLEAEDEEGATAVLDSGTLATDLLSYAVGCVLGRWDTRIALDPSLAPKLADPFASLPICSPGMLVGSDGLPAQRDSIASEEWMRAWPDAITPPPEGSVQSPAIPDAEYPLAVDWDGILVDDPEHEDDILRRVREVLELLWGEHADEIEGEACGLLGVRDLRTYFRNPRQFFEHHIKRYSKSRRKAPIYWLLQSPKRNYGLWLYYHRLDPDILFKALHKYVEPKVRLEESRLDEYEARRRSAGTGGREAKQAEKAVEKQEELLTDLREFRDRLERAAKLHLRPDLNDGVVLNIASLHELVPWKEAKSKWNELLSGKYEWSSIGKQLREKGMA